MEYIFLEVIVGGVEVNLGPWFTTAIVIQSVLTLKKVIVICYSLRYLFKEFDINYNLDLKDLLFRL